MNTGERGLAPARQPDFATRWPNRARVVVAVTIHIDGPSVESGQGFPAVGIYSRGRYSMRRGIHRYLNMLAKHGIPATFFACGYDVEHYPGPHRDILAAGHEIGAHGYQHEAWDLGESEPHLLEKTHRIITEQLGQAPVGWCSPSGRKSALTLPTLRRLGYRYDASEKDLDEPYLVAQSVGAPADFVTLPNNTVSLDDAPVYNMGQALPEEIYQNWIEEFDAIRANEGYLHLTVHPRAANGSGTPARARIVDRFLEHIRGFDDVCFLTLTQLADHCLAHPQQWQTYTVTQESAA